jgi:hypothetical protein
MSSNISVSHSTLAEGPSFVGCDNVTGRIFGEVSKDRNAFFSSIQYSTLHDPEYEGATNRRNAGNHLPVDTAIHPKDTATFVSVDHYF